MPVYAPGLLEYKSSLGSEEAATSSASEKVEETILWLPSRVPASHRAAVWVKGLPDVEERLRTAQCTDALDSVRRILRIKTRMIEFKNKNIRGQRRGTRSRAVIDRVHERARAAAEQYRAARAAKFELVGSGEWEKVHQVLADGDIRGYQDANRLRPRRGRKGTREDDEEEMEPEDEEEVEFELFNEKRTRRDGTGETRRTLSWIWTTDSSGKSIAKAVEELKEGDGEMNKEGGGEVTAEGDSAETAAQSGQEMAVDAAATTPDKTVDGEGSMDVDQGNETGRSLRSKGKKKGKATGRRGKSKGKKTKKIQDDDILRAEWARSRARVERAKEEVMMVKEEMGRTLRFLGWKERWWEGQRTGRANISKELSEGLEAYAIGQARVHRQLASKFKEVWKSPLTEGGTVEDEDSDDEDGGEDEGDESDGDDDEGVDVEEEGGDVAKKA